MKNVQEIMEYLNVGQNRTVWEGKTLDKALELEKQYEREISKGTIGYALICDFDCSPFILEDEDKTEMIEKERFEEAGIVVYKIKSKEDKVFCKHCGDLLVENENHSEDSYETDICDDCMNEHFHPTGSVLCPKCKHKFQIPLTKKEDLTMMYIVIAIREIYENTNVEVAGIFDTPEKAFKAREEVAEWMEQNEQDNYEVFIQPTKINYLTWYSIEKYI